MNTTGLYDAGKSLQSFEKSCYFLEINLDVPFYVFFVNITTSVINGVSSFVAVTANGLVLVVMWRNPTLHTAGNVLLGCLAFSDFIVGLISQPAFIIYKVGENRGDFQSTSLHLAAGLRANRLDSLWCIILNIDCYWCREVHFTVSTVKIPRARHNKEDAIDSPVFLGVSCFARSYTLLVP